MVELVRESHPGEKAKGPGYHPPSVSPLERGSQMHQYRQFTDSSGTIWSIYRVEPRVVSPSLTRLRETLPHMDSERRHPWLLFESSAGDRRRLTPVPGRWDEDCTDSEIAEWCAAADQIPPAPLRRESDSQLPSDRDR
jgi:hypothetical protein